MSDDPNSKNLWERLPAPPPFVWVIIVIICAVIVLVAVFKDKPIDAWGLKIGATNEELKLENEELKRKALTPEDLPELLRTDMSKEQMVTHIQEIARQAAVQPCQFFGDVGPSQSLSGMWKGTWHVTEGNYNGPNPIKDIIRIEGSEGARISGTGTDSKGDYHLVGCDSRYAITFIYVRGVEFINLVGGGVLKKGIVEGELEGIWGQFHSDGRFTRGTTTWKKD